MQAGLLTEIVTFQESKTKRDSLGGISDNWETAFVKRAEIKFSAGNRSLINGEVLNPTSIICKIRYCKDINEKMRFIHDGRKYKIASINRDRKQQTTIIKADMINE